MDSPTFTIIKEYEGRLPLYHMDVYRLEYPDEDLGWDEFFYGDGVTLVEWAGRIEHLLPEHTVRASPFPSGRTASASSPLPRPKGGYSGFAGS